MEIVPLGGDPDCNLTADEVALLNPTATRIAETIACLSPTDCLEALMLIAAAIRRQHRIDDSFNPVEFVLWQGVEQEYQVAA